MWSIECWWNVFFVKNRKSEISYRAKIEVKVSTRAQTGQVPVRALLISFFFLVIFRRMLVKGRIVYWWGVSPPWFKIKTYFNAMYLLYWSSSFHLLEDNRAQKIDETVLKINLQESLNAVRVTRFYWKKQNKTMLWKITFICSAYWVVKIQYYFTLYNQVI